MFIRRQIPRHGLYILLVLAVSYGLSSSLQVMKSSVIGLKNSNDIHLRIHTRRISGETQNQQFNSSKLAEDNLHHRNRERPLTSNSTTESNSTSKEEVDIFPDSPISNNSSSNWTVLDGDSSWVNNASTKDGALDLIDSDKDLIGDLNLKDDSETANDENNPETVQQAENEPAKKGAFTTSILIIVAISAVSGLTMGILAAIIYGHKKRRQRAMSLGSSSSSSKPSQGCGSEQLATYDFDDEENYNVEGSGSCDSSVEGNGVIPQAVVHGMGAKGAGNKLKSTGKLLKGSLHGLGNSLHGIGSSFHGSIASVGSLPEAFVKGKRRSKTGMPESFVEGKKTSNNSLISMDNISVDSSHASTPDLMMSGQSRTSYHENGQSQRSEFPEAYERESSHATFRSQEESQSISPVSDSGRRFGSSKTPDTDIHGILIDKHPPYLSKPEAKRLINRRGNSRDKSGLEEMLSELGDSMSEDEALSAQQRARKNWETDRMAISSPGKIELSDENSR